MSRSYQTIVQYVNIILKMNRLIIAIAGICSLAQAGDTPRPADFGATKTVGWQAEVQQRIANEEYRITRQKDRFHAANRANNLRAYFDSQGVSLQRRTGSEGWRLSMRLHSVGRSGHMRPAARVEPVLGRCIPGAGPGALKGCMRRLEFYHLDALTIEWFVNSRAGVEQGFEVWFKPPGVGELRLEQEISGAKIIQSGKGVKLIPEGGRPLDFKGIKARDRRGHKLEVTLLAENGKLVTLVDDSKALYPIFVE